MDEAIKNPEITKTVEYSKQLERANIEMAKSKQELKETDKQLIEFELALKSLKENTDQLKLNPELAKNTLFIKRTKEKADVVREYQQNIKKINLNPLEKKKYDELCRQ